MYIEDVIEPEIPICDAHHHLSDSPLFLYLFEDFLEDMGNGHNITETVFVECKGHFDKAALSGMRPVDETKFVDDIANQSASGKYGKTRVAAGIVGFADLTLGDAVTPLLEAHISASPDRFRGIRCATCWDKNFQSPTNSPQGLLLDSKFREGFARLQKYDLSYDAWLFHTQLMELADLARVFPDTTIIVNHFGGLLGIGPYARNREAVISEWKRGLAALANCDNVVIKLGGFAMGLCGFGLNDYPAPLNSAALAEIMAPYYLWCIEQFGPDRCMFESNFQVDKQCYSYTVMWNAFKIICKNFTPDERAAMLRDTGVRTYRL